MLGGLWCLIGSAGLRVARGRGVYEETVRKGRKLDILEGRLRKLTPKARERQ